MMKFAMKITDGLCQVIQVKTRRWHVWSADVELVAASFHLRRHSHRVAIGCVNAEIPDGTGSDSYVFGTNRQEFVLELIVYEDQERSAWRACGSIRLARQGI